MQHGRYLIQGKLVQGVFCCVEFQDSKKKGLSIIRAALMGIFIAAGLIPAARSGLLEEYNSRPVSNKLDGGFQEIGIEQGDPGVVLGVDWLRSFWVMSPGFSKNFTSGTKRPTQQPFIEIKSLPKGLEAIELRIFWNNQLGNYGCSHQIFLSTEVPLSKEVESIEQYADKVYYPKGLRRSNLTPGEKLDYRNPGIIVTGNTYLDTPPLLNGFKRDVLDGVNYISFVNSCEGYAFAAKNERLKLGVALDYHNEGSWGELISSKEKTYLVFDIPVELLKSGYKYFNRASLINGCYLRERSSRRKSGDANNKAFAEDTKICAALRADPIK